MSHFDLGYEPHEFKSDRPGYRGTSLQAFFAAFPTEEACFEHLFKTRFTDDPPCPRCGKHGRWQRHRAGKHYFHPCGGIVSPMTGSTFDRTRVPLQLWFYAMLYFANSPESVSGTFLHRQLGISEPTGFRLASRVRMHLAAIDENEKVGGQGKVVMARVETLRRVVNKTKNSPNKARIIVLADDRKALSTVISKPSTTDISSLIQRKVYEDSRLVTDCYATWRLFSNYGANRPLVIHQPTFFLDNPLMPDVAKGFVSYFWKSFIDQFRGVNIEYLWRYLKEYEFRFNRRSHSQDTYWQMLSQFPSLTPHDIQRLTMANSILNFADGSE